MLNLEMGEISASCDITFMEDTTYKILNGEKNRPAYITVENQVQIPIEEEHTLMENQTGENPNIEIIGAEVEIAASDGESHDRVTSPHVLDYKI